MSPAAKKPSRILVIDIGGSNIKMLASGQKEPRKFPSGPKLTPANMVKEIKKVTADWKYDVISIGYPGPVLHDRIVRDPKNLGPGWVRYDFAKAFGKRVKIINDAAMQALGSYEGGRMLFLGLGTGLGSALIVDGVLEPMELAHLPYKNGKTYEDYVGLRGMKKLGKKKWRRHVKKVVIQLQAALAADYIVLGGGQIKLLKKLPPNTRLGSNANSFVGGFRMWEDPESLRRNIALRLKNERRTGK